MPKVPMDYSKTVIYKIVCKDVDIKECYVGQTTSFDKRKSHHKSDCNNVNGKYYNLYVYQFIREYNGWDNWSMIEIEKFNAIDKLDANKRERYWIETLQSTLNKYLPTRTKKEYYEENKEQIKEYYEQNKEQIKEQKKQYREQNKEQISKQKKQYCEQHKEQIKEYKKIWYQKKKSNVTSL